MTKAKETQGAPSIVEHVKLPVGILVDGKRYKDVELTPITTGASYEAQMMARETDLIGLIDLAAMTYVPELRRGLTHDELHNASRQDGNKLEQGRMMLEKKEREQATKSA